MDAQHNGLKEQTTSQIPQIVRQNQYELDTGIGKVTIEMIVFPHYIWVIFTTSTQLTVDGSLQVSMQTPFNDNPTVIDIGADENQANGDEFCMKLAKELGCVVVLSYNLNTKLGLKDQTAVIKFIKGQLPPNTKHSQCMTTN